MPKHPACGTGPAMSRRSFIAALPFAGTAVTAQAKADSLLLALAELETPAGWEPSNVAAAKAYSAYRIREALSLQLPDPSAAAMHLDYQHRAYKDYTQSYWFERDQAEGKRAHPPRCKSTL